MTRASTWKEPSEKEDMEEEINQTLFEITNPHWNRIVRFAE